MEVTAEQIMDIIDHAIVHGAGNSMRDNEVARGYKPIFPGEFPWFSKDEWPEDVVVSLDGNRVRIVAIYALHPNKGAFTRLVLGIIKAGLQPTVISPFADMVAILTNWGWHSKTTGGKFDDIEDAWFPTRKWKELSTRDRDNA